MERERYMPEEAEEEATKLKELKEKGLAEDYKEAEKTTKILESLSGGVEEKYRDKYLDCLETIAGKYGYTNQGGVLEKQIGEGKDKDKVLAVEILNSLGKVEDKYKSGYLDLVKNVGKWHMQHGFEACEKIPDFIEKIDEKDREKFLNVASGLNEKRIAGFDFLEQFSQSVGDFEDKELKDFVDFYGEATKADESGMVRFGDELLKNRFRYWAKEAKEEDKKKYLKEVEEKSAKELEKLTIRF